MRHSPADVASLLLFVLLAGSCDRETPSPPVIEDLRAHDIDAATIRSIEAAVDAVEAAPGSWQRWLDLGMQYHANEMLAQAIPCYEQATALAPDQARPHYYLAQTLAASGELSGGVASMRRAAALAEDFAPAHWRLGLLLLESGDASAAATEFERALELDPSERVARVGLARVALQEGRPEQALEALERVFASPGPNDGYVQRLLGTTYARLGRTAEAERALARAATWSPYWPDPWTTDVEDLRASFGYRNFVGQQLISAGQAEKGVSMLEELRRDHPDEVPSLTLINLGVGYRILERYDEAIATFESVLEALPSNVSALENLARAQLRKAPTADPVTASRLRQSAKEHVRRALELAPSSAVAHGLSGEIFAVEQRHVDAAREYRLAFEYEPSQPIWALAATRIYWQLEDWHAIVELLEPVTRLMPENVEVWYALGVARMRVGHFEAAEEALQRAATLAPGEQPPRQALAELARLRGSPR